MNSRIFGDAMSSGARGIVTAVAVLSLSCLPVPASSFADEADSAVGGTVLRAGDAAGAAAGQEQQAAGTGQDTVSAGGQEQPAAGQAQDISTGFLAFDASGEALSPDAVYFYEPGGTHPVDAIGKSKDALVRAAGDAKADPYFVKYINSAPGNLGDGEAATAAAIIRATDGSGYSGSFAATYRIRKRSLSDESDVHVAVTASYPLADGGKPVPTVVAADKSVELVEGTDFSVSYSNNGQAGKAAVTVSAIDGPGSRLTGKRVLEYQVEGQPDVSKAEVQAIPAQTYAGAPVKPAVTVRLGGRELVEGTDFDVEFSGNDAPGTAKATITGKGVYTGSKTVEFEVTAGGGAGASASSGSPVSVAAATVSALPSATYNGKAHSPKPTVKVNGRKLREGVDYTLSYSKNVNASPGNSKTAIVKITGKGAYTGTRKELFRIKPCNISKAQFAALKDQVLIKKKADTPTVSGTCFGKRLRAGKSAKSSTGDYVVSYSKSQSAGRAKAKIVGIGNYTGTKTIGYNVVTPKIKLDRSKLMIDTTHFNFADLSASIVNGGGVYKTKDIKWKIDGSAVRFYSNGKNLSRISGKKKLKVWGQHFGDATVTAYIQGVAKATCSVRVISNCKQKAPSGDYDCHYSGNYYIRVEGDRFREQGYGNSYVEAYLDNADKICSDYKDYAGANDNIKRIRDYAAEATWYTYRSNGLKIDYDKKAKRIRGVSGPGPYNRQEYNCWRGPSHVGSGYGQLSEKVYIKKKGALSANDWCMFFSSKNQWEYIAHKENGKWKVKSSMKSSAGYSVNHPDSYTQHLIKSSWNLAMTYPGYGGNTLGSPGRYGGSRGMYWHLIHWDTAPSKHGVPSSGGCIHLGRYGDQYTKAENEMYYYTMVEAGLGTRVIMY